MNDIFITHSAVQAVVVLSLLCACGLALGKLKVLGVSLGVAFVFFLGILAGHLGVSVDADMLQYAQNFGLVLFVYALAILLQHLPSRLLFGTDALDITFIP